MFTKEQLYAAYDRLQDSNVSAEEVYQGLVSTATSDLDELMQEIYTEVVLVEDVPMETVQKYFTKLGNFVYFFGERLEKIGIQADISGHSMKEVYNSTYNDNLIGADGKKRTANELVAIAEAASMSESVLNDLYLRAYKTVKFKIESAQSMINTLSKVFSKKMQEQSFSSQFDNSRLLVD